jgi:hypothetical protein
MGRWLLAAAVVMLPLAARAGPIGPVPPAPLQAPAPSYVVRPPAESVDHETGWGLRATLRGRSMELGTGDRRWSADPNFNATDVEAGYGWRKGGASAVIGYGQFDLGPRGDRLGESHQFSDVREEHSGVVGLSMVFHGR